MEEWILFRFPDYQAFMELEGYRENTVVPTPLEWSDEFYSAVMIRKSWLENNKQFKGNSAWE